MSLSANGGKMSFFSTKNTSLQSNFIPEDVLEFSNKNQGMLYYRSDTRSPEQIFKLGFSPRLPEFQNEWWKEAIKSRGYIDDLGIDYRAVDSDPSVCVCMTTKLESAPIFPLSQENCYIYAIALPEFTQIKYLGKGTGDITLSRTGGTPLDPKNIVIDLHNLQSKQVGNICRFFGSQTKNLGLYAGWPLHAYEALTYRVLPQSIICAIRCQREALDLQIEVDCILGEKRRLCAGKQFTFTGSIIENQHFSMGQLLYVGRLGKSKLCEMDYTLVKERAVAEITNIKNQPEYCFTPNIYYGFGGKTF